MHWIKHKILVPGNHDLTADKPFYDHNWQDWHGAKQQRGDLRSNAGDGSCVGDGDSDGGGGHHHCSSAAATVGKEDAVECRTWLQQSCTVLADGAITAKAAETNGIRDDERGAAEIGVAEDSKCSRRCLSTHPPSRKRLRCEPCHYCRRCHAGCGCQSACHSSAASVSTNKIETIRKRIFRYYNNLSYKINEYHHLVYCNVLRCTAPAYAEILPHPMPSATRAVF